MNSDDQVKDLLDLLQLANDRMNNKLRQLDDLRM